MRNGGRCPELLAARGIDPVVFDFTPPQFDSLSLVRIFIPELTQPMSPAMPVLGHRRFRDLPYALGCADRRLDSATSTRIRCRTPSSSMPSSPARRWQRRTVFNLAICTFAAATLGLATRGTLVSDYFVVSYSIGFFVQVCTGVGRVYAPARLPRFLVTVAMTGCGLVLGLALGGRLVAGHPASLLGDDSSLLIGLLISTVVAAGFEGLKQLWDARERLSRAERDALARDKALAEAELRVLQAQVEPHFLFNTLANVISLIRTKPEDAARLLERLTSLLRASLSRTRRTDGTLGDELAVVRAYLDLQSLRMGGRMTYRVEVEPGLETVRVRRSSCNRWWRTPCCTGSSRRPRAGASWCARNGPTRRCVSA